jgi:HD superfamily phosphohydrolase
MSHLSRNLGGEVPIDMDPVPTAEPYRGVSLLSDPVHGYIRFVTIPSRPSAATERDLIDSPWLQRLRSILQLQSARLVFPSAEHSRFVHSLGAMHIAGRFANHLYPAFDRSYPGVLSLPLFEELLRVSALLHDVGHGPFCHFFDENVLGPRFGLSHERIGQFLVRGPLREIIETLDRSPSGAFGKGERLSADWIAYLIGKGAGPNPVPKSASFLSTLKPLFSGLFTVDNLDYILRDSYMCGVAIGPIDLDRLLYYTHIREGKLAIHRSGLGALEIFITVRAFMYRHIYFHRTTRIFDMSLRDLIGDTMEEWGFEDPTKNLRIYAGLTDHALLEEVRKWRNARTVSRRRLGEAWEHFLSRRKEWRTVFERDGILPSGAKMPEELGARLESLVGKGQKRSPFRVDVAFRDTRPENPWQMGERQILVYDPLTEDLSFEPLAELLNKMPVRELTVRIFARPGTRDLKPIEAVKRYFAKGG